MAIRQEGSVFHQSDVELDGNEFINCTFTECVIIYGGTDIFVLDGCAFVNCRWRFVGPADRTMGFLAAMYAQGGDMRKMVENTFESIRQGTPTRPPPKPQAH